MLRTKTSDTNQKKNNRITKKKLKNEVPLFLDGFSVFKFIVQQSYDHDK